MRSVTAIRQEVEVEQQGFQPLTNPLAIHKLIESAVNMGARVDLHFSRSGQSGMKLSSVVMDPGVRGPGLSIALPSAGIACRPDDEVFAIVYLRNQLLLCLHSKHVLWGKGFFRIVSPWRAFTLQRRKQLRYVVPLGYEILVDMDAPSGRRRRMQRRVLDLSAGGLAFEPHSADDATSFAKGECLRNIALRIENRLIIADVKVTVVNGKGARKKVGLEFTRINQGDRQFLLGYVARQMVQFAPYQD